MSEEEDFLSEESYEFEFEEEDEDGEMQEENIEEDYQLENKYYKAKGLKDDSPEEAIKELQSIVDLVDSDHDESNIEWIFKSMKQIIKINYKNGNYPAALKTLVTLVNFLPNFSRNYAEESIGKILNNYSSADNLDFVNSLYDIILDFLNDPSSSGGTNDRLWLKINMNKLYSLLETKDFSGGLSLIQLINEKLETASETTRNSFSLEIIAAEIELYSHQPQSNLTQLNQLYRKSLTITSAVTHPKIMGIIRECGAKVHFYRGNFEKARIEFYECFKNYDEAGSSSKKKTLKYLGLCSILAENEVNPFESQETQTYSQLPEYSNLILLLKAYDESNLSNFKAVQQKMLDERDELVDDEIFIAAAPKILKNLKSKILVNYLKSYTSLRFEFLTSRLDLEQQALEYTILRLANMGKISNVKLDYVNNYVVIEHEPPRPLLLPTLSAKKVYENMRVLDSLNFGRNTEAKNSPGILFTGSNDGMDIDSEQKNSRSVSSQLDEYGQNGFKDASGEPIAQRFLNTHLDVQGLSALIPEIDSWLGYLKSSIPAKAIDSVSQKDQIFSEQRAGNTADNTLFTEDHETETQAANSSTNAGILGSTIVVPTTGEHEEQDELDSEKKLDCLKSWCNQLENHHDSLLRAH